MIETKVGKEKVVTIEPRAGVLQAKAKMTSHNIRHLPVIDEEGRLVGIVSDRDLRSVIPYGLEKEDDDEHVRRKLEEVRVGEVMTPSPYTISENATLQDALLQFMRFNVGAFPVVDGQNRVVAIVSYRDLLRLFIHFLGVEQPGSFLAVTTEQAPVPVQALVDRICEEKVPIASMLVIRPWEQNRSAIYLYLLTKNIARVRKMVEKMEGVSLLNPLQWFLRHFEPGNFPFSKEG